MMEVTRQRRNSNTSSLLTLLQLLVWMSIAGVSYTATAAPTKTAVKKSSTTTTKTKDGANEEDDAVAAALKTPVKYIMPGDKETGEFLLNDMPDYWFPKQAMPCPHLYTSFNGDLSGNADLTIYSPTWHDRSGAIVRRMIYSFAYAYKHGYKYGGSIPRVLERDWPRHRIVHEALIKSLGMSDALKFVEPPSEGNVQHLHLPEQCIHNVELDDEFVEYLRTLQELPSREALFGKGNDKLQVAVHMRRGDAHPCTDNKLQSDRYTANSYYQKILDEYVFVDGITTDDVEVTLFSESDTFETFDEFIDRGYNVKLDGLATDAWAFMVQADILIVSPNSFFSFVPGLLNPNHRIYSPIQEQDFIKVRDGILDESRAILATLKEEDCDDWLAKYPWHTTPDMNW